VAHGPEAQRLAEKYEKDPDHDRPGGKDLRCSNEEQNQRERYRKNGAITEKPRPCRGF
jgi:hypothetical protein